MRYWEIFWTISVVIAGGAFAFVTLVVTLKGGQDLKEMFSRLLEQKRNEDSATTDDER